MQTTSGICLAAGCRPSLDKSDSSSSGTSNCGSERGESVTTTWSQFQVSLGHKLQFEWAGRCERE